MGEIVLAANAILLHLQGIMAYAFDGFAHAAEVLSGSAYGACKRDTFKRSVKMTTLWAFGFSVLISAFYLFFGESILGLFTNIDEVLSTAKIYLPWMIIAPIVSIWSFQLDGIFIGASFTKEMRNAMLVSMLIRALTLGFYYPRIVRAIED